MKRIMLIACLLAGVGTATRAQVYMARTAHVSFNATAAGSPEKIEAVNNEVASKLDKATGRLGFQVPVKSFKFERALMQEHFNENYMESDKYPRAEFDGMVSNIADVNTNNDGTYNVKVSGKLTIHGVTKEVSVPGTVTVKRGQLVMSAKFNVRLADHKINVPSVVADKVAKEAVVTIESALNVVRK
ncbi:YceI family protein [Nemorincola caseinilytica]